jgi:tetratricopeptide (TPR) repeat protein
VTLDASATAPADAHWMPALPNEPPPLRLADLVDLPGRRAAAPSCRDDHTAAPHDLGTAPAFAPVFDVPARGTFSPGSGRFADLLAIELGDSAAAAESSTGAADAPIDVPVALGGNAVIPRMPADVVGPAAEDALDGGLDLGAWLRATTPEESTRMTTAAVPQSGDERADFDATLRAFTAGVDRTIGHEDFDSHYDLGVAFREMGLVEEAIVQFQRAAQAPGRPLRAVEALGQCFLDAGHPELALSTLAEPVAAAAARGDGDASLVAVHYLMGAAAQALGRPDDARRWLVRVVATDVRFRDASSRLAALPPPTPTR